MFLIVLEVEANQPVSCSDHFLQSGTVNKERERAEVRGAFSPRLVSLHVSFLEAGMFQTDIKELWLFPLSFLFFRPPICCSRCSPNINQGNVSLLDVQDGVGVGGVHLVSLNATFHFPGSLQWWCTMRK